MPHPRKAPRLFLRKARGRRAAHWVILDGGYEESTRCVEGDLDGAERALKLYLERKHAAAIASEPRDPSQIPVADVLSLYLKNKAPKHARPEETAQRVRKLAEFFGEDTLADLNGERFRGFVRFSSSDAAARRALEDLRAAINDYRKEGLCAVPIPVPLPPRRPGRERWLNRSEAARLILSAWRFRETQKGVKTDRASRQHVARFILVGLYTGTRAGAICAASFEREAGRGWVDLENGVFYRRAPRERETRKRKPPIRLPDRLLAHMRRWARRQRYVVEWNGKPVKRVIKAFNRTVADAGLDKDVTPHILRHTAVTWAMQNRADPYEAAGYFGMTLQTLLERYGHHHPDHQESARRALERKRTQ